MKKQFKNILLGTKKKNGFSLVVCTAVLTFALGNLVGCSVKEMAADESEVRNIEAEYSIGTVNVDTLRVRAESAEDATVIGLLPNGEEVTILAEENEFYRIIWQEEEDAADGYVRKEYIDVE